MPINWLTVQAITRSKYIPILQDNIFKSNPLFIYLDRTDRIVLDGGVDVREPLLMTPEPFTWYQGFDPIDITPVDPVRSLILQWAFGATGITIDGPAIAANGGEPRVLSLVETRVHNGEMTIRDNLGIALFSDGVAIPKSITGLAAAINTGNLYGGIDRSVNPWWNAQVLNALGGDPTFSIIQQLYGLCTQGNTRPDIAFTTQAIFNKLWSQALPQQRYDGGDEVVIGWDYLKINGMKIFVDSHCPPGYFYALNTEFIKLFVHQDYDFRPTDWMPSLTQDARTMRIEWGGNLLVNNSRFHGVLYGLNET